MREYDPPGGEPDPGAGLEVERSPCAPGYRPSTRDANGVHVPGLHECVSDAEYARRMQIRIDEAPGDSPEKKPAPVSGGTAPFKPSTPPYQFKPWTPPPQTPFEINLQGQISDFLKNWNTDVPYTPEVIQNQQTDAFRNSYGRVGTNKAAIEADAIRRGVLRSSGTDRRVDAVSRDAQSAYAQADRGITNTATQENFQARFNNRTAALDRAQKMLDSQREYLLASETNDFRRQQGLAQLAFGYYGLEQERWSLTQQLNNSNYQFGGTMDWNKLLLQWQILNGITPGQAA